MGKTSGPPIWGLTEIERQILGLLSQGADTPTIASRLRIPRREVRAHEQRIFSKLGVRSSLEAAVVEEFRRRTSAIVGPEGSAVFERFTDEARQIVVLAQEEARMLNHGYIGTEHILLGLIHEGESVAANALESLNISLDAVRHEVEELVGRGQADPPGEIPFTPRSKKVLELSFREALQLGHNYVGTEHILFGLIREGEGVAAQVLQKLGADLNRVRRAVIQRLWGDAPPPGGGMQDLPESQPAKPACPSCSRPLEGALAYRTLQATPVEEGEKPIAFRVFYCTNCGAMLHTSPAE